MSVAQERVQSLLNDLVSRDVDVGLQVAAYHRGQLVIDACAGVANLQTGELVTPDTLFCVFSCTKGITATVIHMLADRGLLDYDAPVSRYWPDFGQNGKMAITIRQVLAHTAGVPQVPDEIGPAESCDWEQACRAVAELTPIWEPGTKTGYHAITFGWILGELARRVDGRAFSQIVKEDIAEPLEIDDLYLGIPDDVEDRVAFLDTFPSEQPSPNALVWRVIPPAYQPLSDWANRSDFRRACIPAGNGIMTARALARFYDGLISSTPGTKLLSQQRLDVATELQTDEDDVVLGSPARKGLGYWLGGEELSSLGTRSTSFGHSGAGGSMGFADPEYELAFALTKSRLVSAEPGKWAAYLVASEVRDALGIPE